MPAMTNPPDWKQDQAETSRLPRKGKPSAQTMLADKYEAGLRKMEAAGYEEFGEAIESHKIVIAALRHAAGATNALSSTPEEASTAAGLAVAWLIEWPEDDNVPVRWWNPATGWMRDANKAAHFCREQDAADYIAAGNWAAVVKPTEHKFVAAPPAAQTDTPSGHRPFYGAECPSYPDCTGGCGLGCTKEIETSAAPHHPSRVSEGQP
jgi:hypothetical protein